MMKMKDNAQMNEMPYVCMEEMEEYISQKTGYDLVVVQTVLDLELEFLEFKGLVEVK